MERLAILHPSAWLVLVFAFGPEVGDRGVARAGDDDRSARPAAGVPSGLEPIGGRWFVRKGDRPTYFYRNGDTDVDLFSYHTRDSNKDGMDNVKIRHDERHLLVDSQGYP